MTEQSENKPERVVPYARYAKMSRIASELAYSMEAALDELVGKEKRKELMKSMSDDTRRWWKHRKEADKIIRKAKREAKECLQKAAAK